METNIRSPLHPLLTMAAISVTVFCAVGAATLTGMVSPSRGTAAEPQLELHQAERAAPVPAPAVAPVPAPAAAPTAKPVVKKKVAPVAPRPEPIYREAGQPPVVAAPVAPGTPGIVESVREVTEPGDAKGLGVIAGGIGGAVLGHQVGSGRGNKLATVLGAVGGAIAGNHIEKQARAVKRWDITVRLEDGTTRTLSNPTEPFWHAGDRVRLHEGRLQPV
ncbi:MAG TPA: glycine zipper 2TM domain-containing protein [Burkholderiales bacterium]|nr:glycine zipper 2TM domain-containing protein [Burkholderiales bacterium]